jgi:hypothetical protein
MSAPHWPRRLALAIALASTVNVFAAAQDSALRLPDHYEFDAQLSARFAPDADGSRAIRLAFDYPAAGAATLAAWQLDIVDARGRVLRRWIGEQGLRNGRGHYSLQWDGRDDAGQRPLAGFYTLRLRAVPSVAVATEADLPLFERVKRAFALAADELIDQRLDVRVGNVRAPNMPAFAGLPRGRDLQRSAATAGLPFDVYYGNLHSQTNHSDGGTPVASCGGSEVPQGGLYGPSDAFAMMDLQAGGDFLLASEHNHMYDGSTSTNTSATPDGANNLFASGKSAASAYNSAHGDFLALYGNEWGVISNGGHLNLINPDALPSWEYNSSNQLIGAVATIKSNYADLYATMRLRGWIGQFNHPSTSQFAIGGTGMAYNADGAEVMVLAEILNTSAFSTNTTETETGRSNYEGAFNTLLERGYKVAPATNQDNHCANWGLSFRNRTGVLLPSGAALTQANFVDALKARRAFAAEDKNAQLILTGNGQVMGQTLRNSGALNLVANYASSSGGSAARVQFFEGVPRRNGTVTQLFEGAGSYSFTPTPGEHFYYVKVTEADGDRLWSAPIWVIQDVASSDTTAPTVSVSESGSSGAITLSATASDNVGVTQVEFYVDGVLKGSDSSSPYAMTLDSTTLSNGSHSLTAKAFDAAGNSATSAPLSFSISNSLERLLNGGFESGASYWTATSGVIDKSSSPAARTGLYKAWLNGYGSSYTDTLYQTVSIPSTVTNATLSFWLRVTSDETTTTTAYDTLKVQVRNSSNTVLATLATYSNLNKGSSYVQRTFDVTAYKGQTIRVYFLGVEGSQVATSFLIDDVSLSTR